MGPTWMKNAMMRARGYDGEGEEGGEFEGGEDFGCDGFVHGEVEGWNMAMMEESIGSVIAKVERSGFLRHSFNLPEASIF